MPRHDWNDDTMVRDREEWREADYRGREERYPGPDQSAFLDRDRDDFRRRDRIEGRSMRNETRHPSRDRLERDRHRDDDRWFGPDDHNRGIPMDETKRLIASNKVEGTPVYDRHGDKLGSVHNFMVDKERGEVVYAVLKHSSGFLGLGERYYPLEWDQLTYDRRLGGYHVRMDEEDLRNFGSFDFDGRYHRRRIRSDRDRY